MGHVQASTQTSKPGLVAAGKPDMSQRLRRVTYGVVMLLGLLNTVHGQLTSIDQFCRGVGFRTFPATECNQFLECNFGRGTVKTCPTNQNYNVNLGRCDGSTCNGRRGLWKQTMPTGGLVSVHCTLMPYTNLVAIWHRGIAWWAGLRPEPGMAQAADPKHEMLSSVQDPIRNRYKGYDVGPPFCSGHTQLPDATILSCGGEYQNMNRRCCDPEDAIYKCRIFKCLGDSVDLCSWTTIPGKMSESRWYPAQLNFPAYTATKGMFVMVMGGSSSASDPYRPSDVPQTVDWVWPFAQDGIRFGTTPPTNFSRTTGDTNLYPVVYLLPWKQDGKYVMFQWAINYGELAVVSDPATTTTPIVTLRQVPPIKPDIAITYPAGGCAALHPLRPDNYAQAKVTFFGGIWGKYSTFAELSRINAWYLGSRSAWTIDLSPSSNLTWDEEFMPDNAVMRTCLPLPNGKILLFHGVRYGRETSTTEGQGCTKEQIFQAWMYNPLAPKGSRFTVDPTLEPTYRAYHGCGLLMPDGSLYAAGGDTNPVPFGGDCIGPRSLKYNVDGYVPPSLYSAILTNRRPSITGLPFSMAYGQAYNISYTGTVDFCSVVTPGANTHLVEQSSRVALLQTLANNRAARVITVRTPSDPTIVFPGPQMVYCVDQGQDVWSAAWWINLQ